MASVAYRNRARTSIKKNTPPPSYVGVAHCWVDLFLTRRKELSRGISSAARFIRCAFRMDKASGLFIGNSLKNMKWKCEVMGEVKEKTE